MVSLWRSCLAAGMAGLLLGGGMTADVPAAETGELILRVTCRSEGENPADGTLTFVLWDEQHQILQRAINLRGNTSFAPLEFSAAGQYIYYITQEAGDRLEIVYDAAVYQVVIDVAEYEGRLTAQVAELNRVCGDPLEEVEVLEALGRDAIPAFENSARTVVGLPPLKDIPRTGSEMQRWLFSGPGLSGKKIGFLPRRWS